MRTQALRAGRSDGFTLLEVLVAVAILGLGLTAVLSAQAGLFASSARTEKISHAVGLARCRMNEIEVELLRDGYPLVDTDEEGRCCNDESLEGFSCAWAVERVVLPEAPTMDEVLAETGSATPGDDESDQQGPGAPGGLAGQGSPLGGEGMPSPSDMGALGALSTIGQTDGDVLGDSPTLSNLAGMMGGSVAGGSSAMAPMVMGMVYPQLKPMLEASIRRVTVTVIWQQGSRERELKVQQFVTNPQQGGFDPLAAEGLEDAVDGLLGGAAGGGDQP